MNVSSITLIYIFFEKYAVPAFFAIGLIYFLYGCIEYFIIGQAGDEERSQHGRELFLKSIAWFVLSMILYGIMAFIGWLSQVSFTAPTSPVTPTGGADMDQEERILPVPNVPTR